MIAPPWDCDFSPKGFYEFVGGMGMQFLLIINSLIDGIAIGMIGCGIIILLLVLALTVVNLRLE